MSPAAHRVDPAGGAAVVDVDGTVVVVGGTVVVGSVVVGTVVDGGFASR
jgi:hypothetical protein